MVLRRFLEIRFEPAGQMALTRPLEAHFEEFWSLLAKWFSRGPWRLILSLLGKWRSREKYKALYRREK